MADRTYRVTEIVGTSQEGIEPAVRNGCGAPSRPCATWTGLR